MLGCFAAPVHRVFVLRVVENFADTGVGVQQLPLNVGRVDWLHQQLRLQLGSAFENPMSPFWMQRCIFGWVEANQATCLSSCRLWLPWSFLSVGRDLKPNIRKFQASSLRKYGHLDDPKRTSPKLRVWTWAVSKRCYEKLHKIERKKQAFKPQRHAGWNWIASMTFSSFFLLIVSRARLTDTVGADWEKLKRGASSWCQWS